MSTLKRYGWTTRTGFLVMLLMVTAALFIPAKAEALCCGWRETEHYYSDASHTTLVGTCVTDECAGTYSCTGTQTEYLTFSRTCCDHCGV